MGGDGGTMIEFLKLLLDRTLGLRDEEESDDDEDDAGRAREVGLSRDESSRR